MHRKTVGSRVELVFFYPALITPSIVKANDLTRSLELSDTFRSVKRLAFFAPKNSLTIEGKRGAMEKKFHAFKITHQKEFLFKLLKHDNSHYTGGSGFNLDILDRKIVHDFWCPDFLTPARYVCLLRHRITVKPTLGVKLFSPQSYSFGEATGSRLLNTNFTPFSSHGQAILWYFNIIMDRDLRIKMKINSDDAQGNMGINFRMAPKNCMTCGWRKTEVNRWRYQ